jgi:hypothetical protein
MKVFPTAAVLSIRTRRAVVPARLYLTELALTRSVSTHETSPVGHFECTQTRAILAEPSSPSQGDTGLISHHLLTVNISNNNIRCK